MAYFKRNGLVLSGTTEAEPSLQVPIVNVKPVTTNEVSVKYDKEKDTVKYGNEELTVKYDKDEQSEFEFVPLADAEEEEEEETKIAESNNVREIEKEIEPIKNLIKVEQKHENENEPRYKWINSKLIGLIEKKYEQNSGGIKTKEPFDYWQYEEAKYIVWVNSRFRCLAESLIKLSNYSRIDRHTLLCVTDAFERLVTSTTFNRLPNDYPFKELIIELFLGLNKTLGEKMNLKMLAFKLTKERKAQLICIRHQLMLHTPEIKFSEIDFVEEKLHQEKAQQLISNKNETEKKSDWRYRYEALKKQGLLKTQQLNKAA
ncbi:MAG: hypothetical protein Q7W45_03755 [Bacteroidota bacterium]|nr:hypothetical protein [Bacteroidota bacterium]MDP3144560.1 hypothetical protein [Bacteroidota bacterium]